MYVTHGKWLSNQSFPDSPGISSKTKILYPTDTQTTLCHQPSLESEAQAEANAIPLPEHPVSSFDRPVSLLEGSMSPTSCHSFDTVGSALESPDEVPPTPSTIATTPSPQLQRATQVWVTPVRFASIRKTVDVRISNHTNPGSPMDVRSRCTPFENQERSDSESIVSRDTRSYA
ncbi:hypothetical protein K469DRAFT_131753 [Zopfia rhizophila CBS 207.26]|uniref:Uncharacterized protein n=1 Tax=Zopfia rhizophila CBS 207.26 TaxID=1314779 RepID=A0A6A6EV75_9PEZI|nr:hypothetical protein K469DRAFT_131753 [Zopfia rhizophila CBS 207.26]